MFSQIGYQELSKKVQDHVQSFFHAQNDKTFYYHNLDHTQTVVAAVLQIAGHYGLNEKDHFIVTAAAWFHDSGYFSDYNDHEKKGAELASTFLRKCGAEEDVIGAVNDCILATRMPQSPKNRLEEMVCDADLFHLGTDNFNRNNKLMRKEVEARKGIAVTKDEWRKVTIRLLESHKYFTDYCQRLLNDKKKKTLDKLKQRLTEKRKTDDVKNKKIKQHNDEVPVIPLDLPENPVSETSQPKKKVKDNRPERGIETMFRITSGNNQRLSDMADNKAHIMISVNSLILGAIISLLLRKLEEYDFLKWPTYLILSVCLMTIVFSVLATRPSLPAGKFTKADIDEKKVNLLFFGNFYRMSIADYTSGMLEVMNDRDFLYGTLIRDVYSQGVVLGRKFKLLRISYNIFMYGLIASVLAFVGASIIAGK